MSQNKNTSKQDIREQLHQAITTSDFYIVHELIGQCDDDILFAAFLMCADKGMTDAFNILLPHVDAHNNGQQAFHFAINNGHYDICSLLAPLTDFECGGQALLQKSFYCNNKDIAPLLLGYIPQTNNDILSNAITQRTDLISVVLDKMTDNVNGENILLASQSGDTNTMHLMMPHINDSNKSRALVGSVICKTSDNLKMVLQNHTFETKDYNIAFVSALLGDNSEMHDLLYPLADPKYVLEQAEKNKIFNTKNLQRLRDHIHAEDEKQHISDEVAGQGTTSKNRKI